MRYIARQLIVRVALAVSALTLTESVAAHAQPKQSLDPPLTVETIGRSWGSASDGAAQISERQQLWRYFFDGSRGDRLR